MVIEVDKAVKELRTPKINQVVKTKMIEDFQESSRLFQTQIIYVYSLFRTIGHQWSDFEESSVSLSSSRFLFFSIIITKSFTLIRTNGTVVVIIDGNIYLSLFFGICILCTFKNLSFFFLDAVELWKNLNKF